MSLSRLRSLVGAGAALWLLALVPLPVSAEVMVGRASVIDGDTIDIRGNRIRFHGVDAPESGQWCLDGAQAAYRCGQHAAFALAEAIGTGNVSCQGLDTDRYDRTIARCFLGAVDLNGWLVGTGWALAYRRFSVEYVAQEAEAQRHGRAMWRGAFDAPWDWRRGRRTVSAHGAVVPSGGPPSADCLIKGNSSRNGKIYHLPGQRHYARTKISPHKGERWFCSEADAQAAGWRRAKG